MARGSAGTAVQDLGTLLRSGAVGGLSDSALLDRFLDTRGEQAEDAFTAVVQRHGPMVMAVCRRILSDPDDADDAFQATFLVLARKARAIAHRELLANWLYGVAVRTARELKTLKVRRLQREGRVNPMARSEAEAVPDENLEELRAALDDELSRLPDSSRATVVLCDLQGRTHHEAARILGVPVGTVSSRLVRAREKLRKRLVRRGLSLSSGTIAAFCAGEAGAQSVSPLLIAATARAAAECLAGAIAATAVSTSVSSLAEGLLRSLWIGKLASKAVVLTLVVVASLGAAAGMVRLAGQQHAPPFQRTAPDDWSWVDKLSNADAPTKERLKRCARSALENYASLHRLVYDFDLTREYFFNDGKNRFTFKTYPYKGRMYWNEGAMRYDYEGENPDQLDKNGNPLPRAKGTYSVLRTREMLAQIQDHELYGVVLKVDPPPKSLDAWRNGHHFDPWVHYVSCFRPEPISLKEFWSGQRLIESREEGNTIILSLTYARNPGWMEITCDKSCDDLPVRWRYGDVQKGKKLMWGEETHEWKQSDGVWYPAHFEKIAYVGEEHRPTKEYDLRVTNLKANTAARIPAAVFMLSDLPFPDGYGGWDTRSQPWGSLIRANGLVRERRIGEPWKDRSSGPVPYPRIAQANGRVEQEEYLALVAEYTAKRRRAEDAMPNAKTELEQSTAIENISKLESAYAGRFLALAEKHKGDSVAADALFTVVTNQFTPRESEQAAEILIRDHLQREALRPLCKELGSLHMVFSRAGENLLRAALTGFPTRTVRAVACHCLAEHLKYKARTFRKLMGPFPDPFWMLLARASGVNAVQDARPGVPESIEAEALQLYTRLADEFGDVTLRNEPSLETARREIFKLRDLAIGKPAPQAEGPDVEGKPMKLSDYRGKVVVLTFSAGWPGGGQYSLERTLVERMKGRPFALLSVNVDPDQESLRKSIQEGTVTWRCWWEGREDGPNRQRWKANEIPSVFVIDANGIIRAKEVEGKALDAVVDHLVNECERGKHVEK